MHIAIIIGSQRKKSKSSKIWVYFQTLLSNLSIHSTSIDLWKNPLPFYDDDKFTPDSAEWEKIWSVNKSILQQSDAFIIITPERSGMASTALKNFFLRCDDWELAHKPALIVSVSGSMGGSYPIAELRMSSYKNTKIVYIPDHIIIRNVEKVIDENGGIIEKDNERLMHKINYSIDQLIAYSKWFAIIRKENAIADNELPYGM